MITFRKATPDDLDALLALYDRVFTAEEAGRTSVGWVRGIYPTRQTLEEALRRNDLFLEEANGALVGAAVFNKLQSDYYAPAPWQIDAHPDEVMVMHTFAIDPTFRRRVSWATPGPCWNFTNATPAKKAAACCASTPTNATAALFRSTQALASSASRSIRTASKDCRRSVCSSSKKCSHPNQ